MKHFREHIYSLEDRNESDISPSWQILQVLFFTCCIIFGFTICFTFGLATNTTQHNCILFSNLSFAFNSTDREGRPNNIKAVNSEFPAVYCELVIYIPLVMSTFACFFAVMFAYCGRGGAGNQSVQEAWRIIMPTIFFNFIGLCLSGYTMHVFQSGLQQFLQSVAAAWGERIINLEDIADLCLNGINVGQDLITYISLTKRMAWLNVSFWGLNFLWILLRLLFNVDFQLVRTTIHVYPRQPNIIRKNRQPSVSSVVSTASSVASTVASPSEFHTPAIRLRTVQFTPSTVGPRPSPEAKQDSSPENKYSTAAVDESEEQVIEEVDYNKQ